MAVTSSAKASSVVPAPKVEGVTSDIKPAVVTSPRAVTSHVRPAVVPISMSPASSLSIPSMPYPVPIRHILTIPPMSPKFTAQDLSADLKPEDLARLTERHILERVPPTEKKKYPSKRCKVCLRRSGYGSSTGVGKQGTRKHPKESVYHCPQCPSKPGLCCYPCYYLYHSKLNYWEPDDAETGGESGGGFGTRYAGNTSRGDDGTHGASHEEGGSRGSGEFNYGGQGSGVGEFGYEGQDSGVGEFSYGGGQGAGPRFVQLEGPPPPLGGRGDAGDGPYSAGEGVFNVDGEQHEHKFCPVPLYGESVYGPGGQ